MAPFATLGLCIGRRALARELQLAASKTGELPLAPLALHLRQRIALCALLNLRSAYFHSTDRSCCCSAVPSRMLRTGSTHRQRIISWTSTPLVPLRTHRSHGRME